MLLQSKSNPPKNVAHEYKITNLWYMAQSEPVQPRIDNSFCCQWEREAEEIGGKSSLLSRRVTLWTYSTQKAYSAGKGNQAWSRHQREARYDVSFHQSLAHTN